MPATENETGEKTEAPTGKRLSMARADGMIGRSLDLSHIVGMTGAFLTLQYVGPMFWNDLIILTRAALSSRYTSDPLTLSALKESWFTLLAIVLPHILLLTLLSGVAGSGCTALQTKFNFSWKLLRPKWHLLNPISGIRRILSLSNSIQLGKAILKLSVIGPLAYFSFSGLFPEIIGLINVPTPYLLPFTSAAVGEIFWSIAYFLFVLGIADLVYQKWDTYRQIKMTKVEVKDERKALEGDEEVKRAFIQKGLMRVRQRMLTAVKRADVIITNPTHIAVALEYDMNTPGSAPRVVAKGRAHLAERIKAIGRQNGVPIIERKLLARALYRSVEVGHVIPCELYQAVAEVLAYVYKLRGHNPFQRRNTGASGSRRERTTERGKKRDNR